MEQRHRCNRNTLTIPASMLRDQRVGVTTCRLGNLLMMRSPTKHVQVFVVYLEATLLSTVSSNDHPQRAHEWKAGRGTEKKTPKTKTSGTFSDPHLPAASTILPNRPGLCNTSKCRLAKMLLPFGIYDDSRQCDTLCVPRV